MTYGMQPRQHRQQRPKAQALQWISFEFQVLSETSGITMTMVVDYRRRRRMTTVVVVLRSSQSEERPAKTENKKGKVRKEKLTASYSPSQTHNSSYSVAHTPDNPPAPVRAPDSQLAWRSGTRGRTAAAAACQAAVLDTPSAASRTVVPAGAEATAAARAWAQATGAAAGTAGGTAAAGGTVAGRIARWGLGSRREVGLRRLCRAIGGIAAWGLWCC